MSGRRLFGGRSRQGQAAAFIGVAVGAGVLGFTAGSLGRQVLATQNARIERVNLELRENNTALESALRNARVPLQRRIHELEQALARDPARAEAELALRAAEAAERAAEAAGRVQATETARAEASPSETPDTGEVAVSAVSGAAGAALAGPEIPPELADARAALRAANAREQQARAASETRAAELRDLEELREQQRAERTQLEGEIASLGDSLNAEEDAREDLEAENRRLSKRITELELASRESPEERFAGASALAPVGLAVPQAMIAGPVRPAASTPAPAPKTRPARSAARSAGPAPVPADIAPAGPTQDEPAPASVAAAPRSGLPAAMPPVADPYETDPSVADPDQAAETSVAESADSGLPPGSCASLDAPEFQLEAAGEAVQRFDGQLRMRLVQTDDGLALELGSGGERYPLESTPQHVSFDCAGTPYIVSVCQIDDDAVASGTIWLADTWRNPCR